MKIILANTAGFCFGVSRAIKMVENCLEQEKHKKIYSLGPVIHNQQVVNSLKEKGLKVIENLDQIDEDSVLIIRAHGVSPEIYNWVKEKNIIIIDATCPFVKKIHDHVSKCNENGYKVVIVGNRNHPEVIGIKGWAKDAIIIEDEKEAQELKTLDKVCVVAQTTLNKEKWESITSILKKNLKECEIFNTICNATYERQKEAEEIAQKVDVMLVIGDPNSSNTNKLYQISKKFCDRSYFIENVNQLDAIQIKDYEKIGITAGASTPDYLINEVVQKLDNIVKRKNEIKENV